ncbi:MAG TPA: TolC family protein [Vicinamibacterales bacterium]|nr:TolC family protein [Vicinamibacterales bacterium]
MTYGRRRLAAWVAASLLGAAPAALAQSLAPSSGPVRPLTLGEALSRGLANSQHLADMEARTRAADAGVAAGTAAARPDLSLLGGYQRTNHVQPFAIALPGAPAQVVYPDIPDNYRARLDLQWPIYTGGRTGALERAAAAERGAAGKDLEAARADLRLEITRAYWALVTARETEAVLARSLDAIDAQVADLQTRLDQGLIPPNDLLSAQAQQARQRGLAVEAGNTRATAEADLRRLTGIDDPGALTPTDPLPEPMAGSGDVAHAPGMAGGSASVAASGSAGQASNLPVSTMIARAMAQRPERGALQDRTVSAVARRSAAASTARPQVAVDAGYDYARPNPRIFPRREQWQTSWDLSVNLAWTLWDGGRRAASEAEAAANADAARARLADFDRQLAFDVRQRANDLDSSRAVVTATEAEVKAAVEAERVVGERYRAGVVTPTDVLEAQVARLQADLDRTRALANVRLAEARLARALGR